MKPTLTIKKIVLALMLIVGFSYSSKAQSTTSMKKSDDSKVIAVSYTENDFHISPSPVAKEIKIRASFNTEGGSVQIMNEKGVEVFNGILKNNTIDASAFAAGMYLFVYTKDGNKIVKGFVKQ